MRKKRIVSLSYDLTVLAVGLLIAPYGLGIYEAYKGFNLSTALVAAIPVTGQVYWFVERSKVLGLWNSFTYCYLSAPAVYIVAVLMHRSATRNVT